MLKIQPAYAQESLKKTIAFIEEKLANDDFTYTNKKSQRQKKPNIRSNIDVLDTAWKLIKTRGETVPLRPFDIETLDNLLKNKDNVVISNVDLLKYKLMGDSFS